MKKTPPPLSSSSIYFFPNFPSSKLATPTKRKSATSVACATTAECWIGRWCRIAPTGMPLSEIQAKVGSKRGHLGRVRCAGGFSRGLQKLQTWSTMRQPGTVPPNYSSSQITQIPPVLSAENTVWGLREIDETPETTMAASQLTPTALSKEFIPFALSSRPKVLCHLQDLEPNPLASLGHE
jgi:hypothetical protein